MATTAKLPVAKTVDEYIERYPPKVQTVLRKLRATIRKAAPKADEVISYAIPGYKYHGMLIFFAAFANHVSVYPAPRTNVQFKKELAAYKGGKGTIQFPMDEPIPYELVTRIVKFRMKDNEARVAAKQRRPVATKKNN